MQDYTTTNREADYPERSPRPVLVYGDKGYISQKNIRVVTLMNPVVSQPTCSPKEEMNTEPPIKDGAVLSIAWLRCRVVRV